MKVQAFYVEIQNFNVARIRFTKKEPADIWKLIPSKMSNYTTKIFSSDIIEWNDLSPDLQNTKL